jgi:HEAT repeat protein
LARERNVLVLTEICDSLALLRDERSLQQLRRLAEEHKSPLVRSYALMAIADISGEKSIPYLKERRRRDRSRRIRATLDCTLFAKGADEVLSDLLGDLRSPDFKVRNLVANLLYHYAPRRRRSDILAALREAAANEPFQGVRGDMERAIEELSGSSER